MVSKEKLVDGNLSLILQALLCETSYGEHNIVVYPDLDSFREIYTRLTKARIEKFNDLVMLMPHYETIKSVEQSLAELDINVKKLKTEKGSIDIIDSYHAFFDPEQEFLEVIAAGVDTAMRNGKSGLVVIADMGSFYHRQAIEKMIDHECRIGVAEVASKQKQQQQDHYYHQRFVLFCCYHKKDFEKLTKEQEEGLCRNHHKNLSVKES